jgi:hypothetical protein
MSMNIEMIKTPEFISFAEDKINLAIKVAETKVKDSQKYQKEYEALNNKNELAAIEEYKSFKSEGEVYEEIWKIYSFDYKEGAEQKMAKEFPSIYKWYKSSSDREEFVTLPLRIQAHKEVLANHNSSKCLLPDIVLMRATMNYESHQKEFDKVKHLQTEFNKATSTAGVDELRAFNKFKEFKLNEFRLNLEYDRFGTIVEDELEKKLNKFPVTSKWMYHNEKKHDFFYQPGLLKAYKDLLKEDSILYIKAAGVECDNKLVNGGNSSTGSLVMLILGLIGLVSSILLAIFVKGKYFYYFLGAGIFSAVAAVIGLVLLLYKK